MDKEAELPKLKDQDLIKLRENEKVKAEADKLKAENLQKL